MDKVFKKQLEKFGIESTRIVEENLQKKRQQEFAVNTIEVIRVLMDSMQGRQWLYSKLNMCGVYATPFIAGHPDVTAYLCGLQDFGHSLQREIMASAPEKYFLMIQEEEARNSSPQSI